MGFVCDEEGGVEFWSQRMYDMKSSLSSGYMRFDSLRVRDLLVDLALIGLLGDES
jgi:hypothetical protein